MNLWAAQQAYELVAQLVQIGGRAWALEADIALAASVASLFNDLEQQLIGTKVLANNALASEPAHSGRNYRFEAMFLRGHPRHPARRRRSVYLDNSPNLVDGL